MTTDLRDPYGWIITYTERKFWPMEPRVDEIHLEDIAHALALCNRYAGHTLLPYSVAEHAVQVSNAAAWIAFAEEMDTSRIAAVAMRALHHDDTEAYLGDMTRPVKRHPSMAGYVEAESRLDALIIQRFGLADDEDTRRIVKQADNAVLTTERATRSLFSGKGALKDWKPAEPAANVIIHGMYWMAAEDAWLQRHHQLLGQLLRRPAEAL